MAELKGNSSSNNGNAKYSVEEAQPFIEQNNLIGDIIIVDGSINKGAKHAEAERLEEPEDRYFLVYIIMVIHGIGTLMPWNMFITATVYFIDYKLAGSDNEAYRKYFLSCLGFASQIPNLLLNLVNLLAQCGGGGGCSQAARITWSIIVVVIMFIFTIILAMLDSSQWVAQFFWITMVSVVIINSANGVYQNSIYGTAACLPMKYTNAVVTGSNMSGTITAVLNLIATAVAPNPRTAAIYYFLAAVFVLLLAFDAYFVLPLCKFYRFYHEQTTVGTSESGERMPPYREIFKKCYVHHLSVWFVFFVTLTCFPAIQANIQSSGTFGFDEEKVSKYFVPIACFLVFNVFALLGNIATEFVKRPGPRYVWLPVLLRGFFIPFFMYCNFNPEARTLPVLIHNDAVYIVGGIIFAFSSGYLSSLCMMYAPTNVAPQHQGIAGMLSAFFLILGIFSGVCFSFLVIFFVENIGYIPAMTTPAPLNSTLANVTMTQLADFVTTVLPTSGF